MKSWIKSGTIKVIPKGVFKLNSNSKKDVQESIKAEIKKASDALQKAENMVREDLGKNAPEENILLPKDSVLKMPRRYFRTLHTISKKYKLYLLHDKILAKNLSYSIQYTDFINYILYRTEFGRGGLSIGALFRKHAIITATTIVEGIIMGFVEKTYLKCSECRKFGKNCKIKISSVYYKNRSIFKKYIDHQTSFNFHKALKYLKSANIISYEKYKQLNKLRNYRNHIHIQYIDKETKSRQRDFMNEDYSLDIYNNVINSLEYVSKSIDRLLDSCENFYN